MGCWCKNNMQYLQCAGGKKTAHYAFIKFNQHDCFLDIDTQGRNSIMNSSHQSINGWMKFLKSAIDCEALLHTYYKKGRGEVTSMGWIGYQTQGDTNWILKRVFVVWNWWILLTGIAILSRTLLVRRTVTITEPPIKAYLVRVVRGRKGGMVNKAMNAMDHFSYFFRYLMLNGFKWLKWNYLISLTAIRWHPWSSTLLPQKFSSLLCDVD